MDKPYVIACVIAGICAGALAVGEFWYSRRLDFVKHSQYLLYYILLQCVVGIAGMASLRWLIENRFVDLGGFADSSPYLKAVIVGSFARWLSTVNIFDGGQGRTVGLKLLVDGLAERIREDERIARWDYIKDIEKRYPTPQAVMEIARNWKAPNRQPSEHKAFLGDLKDAPTAHEAIEQCLEFLGKRICDKAFQ